MNLFGRIKNLPLLTTLLTMTALGSACNNPTDIVFDDEFSTELKGHVKWARPEAINDLTATLTTAAGTFELMTGQALFDGDTKGTEGHAVSFWAVKGEARSVQFALDDKPVISLELPAMSLLSRPDGSPIAWGDSVLITLELDDTDLAVRIMPEGLQFHPMYAAKLSMSYAVADEDLNGDGIVNANDRDIEQSLNIWSQPTAQDSWWPIDSQKLSGPRSIFGGITQSSGYAVSW